MSELKILGMADTFILHTWSQKKKTVNTFYMQSMKVEMNKS